MTAEFIRDRLFKPFDSTKGSKGMGIGAYQAREYVRSLGGDVAVESTPGVGTRFTIQLPLLTRESPTPPPGVPDTGAGESAIQSKAVTRSARHSTLSTSDVAAAAAPNTAGS